MEKNSKIIWICVIVVLAIIVVLFLMFGNQSSVNTVATTSSTPTVLPTTEPVSSQDIGPQDIGAGSVSIAYADALVKYADRRIQLNAACQATPNLVTYKDNTGIMIDNRSAQAKTITVGYTFTIKAWGFKIVVLPDVYLKSKTLLVDCGQYKNVATILVQE